MVLVCRNFKKNEIQMTIIQVPYKTNEKESISFLMKMININKFNHMRFRSI